MEINDNEKKFENVISTLKNLSRVNAKENFETDLMRKINSGKIEKERTGFWLDILRPSKLIPSAAVAVILIIMFIVKFDAQRPVDPLAMQPRLREDVIASSSSNSSVGETIDEQLKKDALLENKENFTAGNGNVNVLTNSNIKSGLNFRLANITKSQRQEVVALKQKFELMVKKGRN